MPRMPSWNHGPSWSFNQRSHCLWKHSLHGHDLGVLWQDSARKLKLKQKYLDHKTFFFFEGLDITCIKVTRYHISYNACHTVILMRAHSEAMRNRQFECTFCLWGFLLWFLLLLFLMGQRQFSYSISLKLQRCLPPQTFSPGPTFSSKRCIFLSPQKQLLSSASYPCSGSQNSLNCSRNRLRKRASTQSSSITGTLGSSEDTDMSSSLGNCPLQFLSLL